MYCMICRMVVSVTVGLAMYIFSLFIYHKDGLLHIMFDCATVSRLSKIHNILSMLYVYIQCISCCILPIVTCGIGQSMKHCVLYNCEYKNMHS